MIALLLAIFSWLPVFDTDPKDATLLFVGDAMQHGPQIESARTPGGSYDYTPCFEYLREEIETADFAAANLECPLAGPPYSGYPRFSAPDEFAATLKAVGFDLLQTANNHALDCGDRGALRTLAVLDSLAVPHIGTYAGGDSARNVAPPYIATIAGYKVAFLAYTYGTNGIPVRNTSKLAVNYIDYDRMADDVSRARKAGAQLVCVMIHWGVEYMLTPGKTQRHTAEYLMSLGVDMIIGGHPHVVQPMELRFNVCTGRNTLIVYSLGNFISNQNDTNSRGGALVRVNIGMECGTPQVKAAQWQLFFVQKPSAGKGAYQLIPQHREELLLPHSERQYHDFMKTAGSLFRRSNVNVPELEP